MSRSATEVSCQCTKCGELFTLDLLPVDDRRSAQVRLGGAHYRAILGRRLEWTNGQLIHRPGVCSGRVRLLGGFASGPAISRNAAEDARPSDAHPELSEDDRALIDIAATFDPLPTEPAQYFTGFNSYSHGLRTLFSGQPGDAPGDEPTSGHP